jgi:malic enzyme
VSLDVGTDNGELRSDELYVGWRQPRLRGAEYDALVEEFVQAVKRRWPAALLQWEDFKKQNAFDLLDRYRHVLPSFNDDIQGTAAVAVAGVLTAGRVTGTPIEQQRIVMLGGGAAGIGIARQLRTTLRAAGVAGDALVRAIAVLDSGGLLIDGRPLREASKRDFAWPTRVADAFGLDPAHPPDLLSVITALRPTVLIGTTGEPGCFTEQVIRAMAAHCDRPAIFPFSNPTSKSEAIPADLLKWTDGRALIATGSPFAPVTFGNRTIQVSQGNNVYVFPGVGLGALIAQAREVNDEMFAAAVVALAQCATADDLAAGMLYPPLRQLRPVTVRVATAVAKAARDSGVGRDLSDESISEAIVTAMWVPSYPKLIPVNENSND